LAEDGTGATDEDMMQKAMGRKAAKILDGVRYEQLFHIFS
jgi:hypothetical protein